MLLAVVLPVMALFFFGDKILSTLRADSPEYLQARTKFLPLYSKMTSYDRWSREIEIAQKRLHVKVNAQPADQQKDEFLKKMEDEGIKRQVQISAHRWLPVTKSKKSGVQKRAFQIDCVATFPNLIEFVKGVEELPVPVVIDEVSLSKRAGERNEKQEIKATLQMHLFIFPEGAANGSPKP